MARRARAFAIAILSSVSMGSAGCAVSYAPNQPLPARDFSVDTPDLGGVGVGGNGGDDLAVATTAMDLAVAQDLAARDLAAAAPHDLAPACVDDGDGGVAPTLWLAAPAAGGLFTARLRGGAWTALPTVASAAVDDVAMAAVAGKPMLAARLHDTTLQAAAWDSCRDTFASPAAIAAGAAAANRPAFVGSSGGGSAGDLVFRGAVNGDQREYWAHFDGAAWGAIATEGNFLATLPPAAVRAGGAVHAIFVGTDANLYDGVVQASGGGAATQLTGNTSNLAATAAVAPGGAVHVLYTGTNEHIYWFVTSAPATVHDLCDGQPSGCFIVSDAAPLIGFGSDGNAVAVYHGTDGKLYASRLSGTQWGAAAGISGSDTTSLPAAIATGAPGGDVADVVYVRSDGTPRHAALTAGGWQAPVTVAAATLTGAPALAATP